MARSFVFLGTGSSAGVPVIGCACSVCQSPLLKDKRLRPAGLIHWDGKTFLIDVGPDFRQQALREKITHLDGLLITHTHFDHVAGIDDLRVFAIREEKAVPCLLSEESLKGLQTQYSYLFKATRQVLDCETFPIGKENIVFQGVEIQLCHYEQGTMSVTGFRFGDFAYVLDIRQFDESLYEKLKNLKTLVVSALRHDPSPAHFSLQEGIAFAEKVGAEKTWFSHIAHQVNYEEVMKTLPPHIALSYDGLRIELE